MFGWLAGGNCDSVLKFQRGCGGKELNKSKGSLPDFLQNTQINSSEKNVSNLF